MLYLEFCGEKRWHNQKILSGLVQMKQTIIGQKNKKKQTAKGRAKSQGGCINKVKGAKNVSNEAKLSADLTSL